MADADMILTTLNDPRNSKALTVKGDALYSLGNFEHAILNYHRAIKHSSSKVSTKHSFRARSNGRIVFFAFVHSTTNQGTLRKVSHFSKSLVFTKSCYFRHAKNTSFQMEQGCRMHKTHQCFFCKNGPFPASFSSFLYLQHSKQIYARCKSFLMTGFKSLTSGVGIDRSTN